MVKNTSVLIKDEKSVKWQDIPVTTYSLVVLTNFEIDLEMLYRYCPITDYEIIKKKRGRKKKGHVQKVPEILPPGSIISCQMEGNCRGVSLRKLKKKKKKTSRQYFLQNITMDMILDNNKIANIKISSKRFIQMTGCTVEKHYCDVIKHLYQHILNIKEYVGHPIYKLVPLNEDWEKSIETYKVEKNPIVIYNKTMINKDFRVDFNINRQKLCEVISEFESEVYTIFNPANYAGAMIRYPNNHAFESSILKHEFTLNTLEDDKQSEKDEKDKQSNKDFSFKTKVSRVSYDEYFSYLDNKRKTKIKKKIEQSKNTHTFLVFGPGTIIQTGLGDSQPEVYNSFIRFLYKHRNEIEAKYETS